MFVDAVAVRCGPELSGRNFGAGMSGGVAYVYDPDGEFEDRVNREMVTVSTTLDYSDRALLRRLVENHHEYTDSDRAANILDDWKAALDDFVRVFPDAYADVIERGIGSDVREEPPAPAKPVYHTATDSSRVISSDD